MRVAICGAGNVGRFLAKDLAAVGHSILLMEKEPEVVERYRDRIAVEWFVGDACEVSVLQKAGFDGMDVVVAATGDDEDNLVISLLSKQEFAVPKVVARVNHPENLWMFNESWGVDIPVSAPHILSAVVEEALTVDVLIGLLRLEGAGARLMEVKLGPDSPALDSTVADLALPRDSSVVAVVRDNHLIVPRGDTVLKRGDEVLILAREEVEAEVAKRFVPGAGKRPS
jgi:trk system potassium uptake protein TrkA